MSAWVVDSFRESHKPGASLSAIPEDRRRFREWLKDRGNPWNPWKKTLLDDSSSSEFVADAGSRTISVPAAMTDAALELRSIPMEDPVAAGIPPWERTPEDTGLAMQFSENAGALPPAPSATAAAARESGDSLDFSMPGPVRGPCKVEFSSVDAVALHPDISHEAGEQLAAEDDLILAPPGPIPQIVSPEPSVTALWGISALLFACRRKLLSKS